MRLFDRLRQWFRSKQQSSIDYSIVPIPKPTRDHILQEIQGEPEWMCEWGGYRHTPSGPSAVKWERDNPNNRTNPHPITDGVKAARYFKCVFSTEDQRDIAIRFMNTRKAFEPNDRSTAR